LVGLFFTSTKGLTLVLLCADMVPYEELSIFVPLAVLKNAFSWGVKVLLNVDSTGLKKSASKPSCSLALRCERAI